MAGRAHSRVQPPRFLLITAAVVLLTTAAFAASFRLVPVQASEKARELAPGKILVARRSLEDPNFAETVILVVQHNGDGTLGLILNRQTKFTVSRLARDLAGAKGRTEPLYLGGPVETSGVMGLIRTTAKLDDSTHVFADVYMISSKPAVEKAIASTSDTKTFRLYLGYAGWDTGQLEWEMGLDAWDVVPANAEIVFDPHPETLWSRLAQQEGMQMVAAPATPYGFPARILSVHAAD